MNVNDVLRFWFGEPGPTSLVGERQGELWWKKNPDTDAAIRERFEASVRAATAGELDAWASSPEAVLALIILLDQMRRNIYRDTPEAFSADPLAREWTRRLLDAREDRALAPLQRVFAYMPLEHSEELGDQEDCLALFGELRDEAEDDERAAFELYFGFAEQHAVIIRRFGRFPHRNAILGREPTAEEQAFLEQPNSSF